MKWAFLKLFFALLIIFQLHSSGAQPNVDIDAANAAADAAAQAAENPSGINHRTRCDDEDAVRLRTLANLAAGVRWCVDGLTQAAQAGAEDLSSLFDANIAVGGSCAAGFIAFNTSLGWAQRNGLFSPVGYAAVTPARRLARQRTKVIDTAFYAQFKVQTQEMWC